MKALTPKQKMFADEYIISGNATESYIKAYASQSRKSASANCKKLLRKDYIKAYIEKRMEEIDDQKVAKQKEVLEYLTAVMRGESNSTTVVIEGLGEGISEAREMHRLPEEKDRLKAAELLGKRYGMFREQIDLNAETVVIVDDIKE